MSERNKTSRVVAVGLALLLAATCIHAADQARSIGVTAALCADGTLAEVVELREHADSGKSEKEPARKFDIEKYPANGAGQFAQSTPLFRARSVNGTEHRGEELYQKRGMVVMISAPNLTQCEKQKRWEKALRKEAWPETNAPQCVVIEDMSQARSYREKAREMMREKAQKDARLLFILDEEGDLRRQFGVMENETVILVVDAAGSVIHHECDDVDPDRDAARRVMAQVYRLADGAAAANQVAATQAKP
jgi:hypothetical protein